MRDTEYEKHLAVILKAREELIAAEETIKRIRTSKEFLAAKDYFATQQHRGKIKEAPKKSNDYKVIE